MRLEKGATPEEGERCQAIFSILKGLPERQCFNIAINVAARVIAASAESLSDAMAEARNFRKNIERCISVNWKVVEGGRRQMRARQPTLADPPAQGSVTAERAQMVREIIARVRPTICPTYGSSPHGLTESIEGRISSVDFESLLAVLIERGVIRKEDCQDGQAPAASRRDLN